MNLNLVRLFIEWELPSWLKHTNLATNLSTLFSDFWSVNLCFTKKFKLFYFNLNFISIFVFVGVLGASTQTRCTVTVNCCGWPICWSSTQSLGTLKPQLLATIQSVCRDARSPLSLQRSSTVVRPFTSQCTRSVQIKMINRH